MRRFVVLSVLSVFAVVGGAVVPVHAVEPMLRAPTDAPVLDPFRLPSGPYGAGNRGIEYDTAPGDAVAAAGPGRVVFAGSVAGTTWITIDHGSGLRTSYGPVQRLGVGRGDVVARGERIADAAGLLHFSARIGETYVDPATLFGELVVEVRLVPHDTDDDAATRAADERAERLRLYDLVQERSGGGGGLISRIGGWFAGVARKVVPDELIAGLVHTIDIALALRRGLDRDRLVFDLIGGLVAIVDPEPCSDAGELAGAAPATSQRRVAVVLDGLGSTSESGGFADDLDLDELGYASDDVVRFSYAGGLTDGGGASWSGDVPRTSYGDDAAGRPVEESVAALAETLRQVRAANPDARIDLYGHSLGGVVARLASAEVEADVDLGIVMTFASPHGGAPLATINDALFGTPPGIVIGEGLDVFDPSSPLRSPAATDLSEAGFVGETASVAFPDGVHAVTIGHRADLVVPGTEADAPGARHVIVGGFDPVGAHGDIGALPEVRDEIRLAMAGLPPACVGFGDAVFDLVAGTSIATAERALAGGVIAAGSLGDGG
ncbi:MAG: peptidoglycan DD-metalloendopeptidase family protein [Actinomycetota bacterium]